jgi:hypothetical protein
MASPSDHPGSQRLLRAALLGLGLGLLAGALLLVGSALRGMLAGPDCSGLRPFECDMERQSLASLGRMQAVAGAALALLSISVFLVLRKKPAAAPPA